MFGEAPRIPRKKGQPAKSDKHSDLYTDEDPVGTIHGLGFKDVETAKASVAKIEKSDRTHAHKIQAAVAMEQRAKEMGKKAEAAIYRAYIEKMKIKTKKMNESLWDNIRKKKERIKRGSGERMRKKGEKGAPTAAQIKQAESLWDNIRKKRARIAKGSGEKMGPKGSVPQKNFKSSEKFSDSPRADAARKRKNKMKGKKYKGESLWDNIRKKRERIKKGSGEKMRKKGEKGAPTDAQIKRAQ